LVLPGFYTLTLSSGDWSQTQSFQVQIDPRIKEDGVSQKDLEEQLALNLQIREALSRTRMAVARIRGVKTSDSEKLSQLKDVEQELIQTEEGKVGAQLEPKLMRQLTYLYGMTTQADQKPGNDAYMRLTDIEQKLEKLLKRLEKILKN